MWPVCTCFTVIHSYTLVLETRFYFFCLKSDYFLSVADAVLCGWESPVARGWNVELSDNSSELDKNDFTYCTEVVCSERNTASELSDARNRARWCKMVEFQIFRRVYKMAKSFILCLFAWNNLATTGRIFTKFGVWDFWGGGGKLGRKIRLN